MKYLRKALFPFAILYGLAVRLRNHMYDIGSRKAIEFNVPVICVGNLVAGGAGKTPMTEYLVRRFYGSYKISTLSRGYGRKTRGFKLADSSDNHSTIGDEPFQLFRKFGDKIEVAVGEERALAIPEILFRKPETNLIILDDAYQHRAVKPMASILLTDYHFPFYKDSLLPVGMLREQKAGAKRADFIVVTKCPEDLSEEEAGNIKTGIEKYCRPETPVFFTKIKYGKPVGFSVDSLFPENWVAVAGIANPKPFFGHLESCMHVVKYLSFPDHHRFKESEINGIIEQAEKSKGNTGVITTEKDYVRFLEFEEQILRNNIPFFYVPIVCSFLFEENKFDKMISDAIIAFESKHQ